MGGPSHTGGDEDTWENIDGLDMVPPGEEGMFMSNAGEDDAVFHEIINYAVPQKYVAVLFVFIRL
jgi:hypothetical protein